MGKTLSEPPRIFHVNWFRKNEEGKFLWPGYGQNMRVLKWIVERSLDRAGAVETPIGWVPSVSDMNLEGLDMTEEQWNELMAVDPKRLKLQTLSHEELFLKLLERLPKELIFERQLLISRL